MFASFTLEAKSLILTSQEEMRKLNHRWMTPEHVMLSILQQGQRNCMGARFLLTLPIEEDQLVQMAERASLQTARTDCESAPAIELLIQNAIAIAHAFGHRFVTTGHILYAMFSDAPGKLGEALQREGLDLTDSLVALRDQLSERAWDEAQE